MAGLCHVYGSHALNRGATLAEVQFTLGHANVATTSDRHRRDALRLEAERRQNCDDDSDAMCWRHAAKVGFPIFEAFCSPFGSVSTM